MFEVGDKVELTCNFAPEKYYKSHAIVIGHPRASSVKFFDVYEIQFDDMFVMKVSRNNLAKVKNMLWCFVIFFCNVSKNVPRHKKYFILEYKAMNI